MFVRQFQQKDVDAVVQRMLALIRHIRDETHDPYFVWNGLDPLTLRNDL